MLFAELQACLSYCLNTYVDAEAISILFRNAGMSELFICFAEIFGCLSYVYTFDEMQGCLSYFYIVEHVQGCLSYSYTFCKRMQGCPSYFYTV